MATYFITGATGTVGKEVVQHLLEQGHQVTAATRHPQDSSALFGEQVNAVHFDFTDPSTYASALQSDGVFLLGPPLDINLFSMLEPFVDYLQARAGLRVVYLSASGMEELDSMPFHRQMEEKLEASNLDVCVVRPGFFMQNFGNYERENIKERQVVFVPAGEGKTAFISTRDIGACVAVLLQRSSLDQRIFTLTGDTALDYFQAAELLSDITGKTITYANPDEPTYRQVLEQAGAPAFVADYMIPIYGLIKAGKVNQITQEVEQLTGRPPETLVDVLKRDFN
jgi:uncharacterized protein YbjT (DUF2867 family)